MHTEREIRTNNSTFKSDKMYYNCKIVTEIAPFFFFLSFTTDVILRLIHWWFTSLTCLCGRRNPSLTGQEAVGPVNGGSELDTLKQEIINEVRREFQRMKQEIIEGKFTRRLLLFYWSDSWLLLLFVDCLKKLMFWMLT